MSGNNVHKNSETCKIPSSRFPGVEQLFIHFIFFTWGCLANFLNKFESIIFSNISWVSIKYKLEWAVGFFEYIVRPTLHVFEMKIYFKVQ